MTRDSKSKTFRLTAVTATDRFDWVTQCKVCIWVKHHTMVQRAALDRRPTTVDDDDARSRRLDVFSRSSFLAELSREPLVNLEIGGGDGGSRAEEHFAKIVGRNRRREDARRVSEPGELFEG